MPLPSDPDLFASPNLAPLLEGAPTPVLKVMMAGSELRHLQPGERLLAIEREQLRHVIETVPVVALNLLRMLAKRARNDNRRLQDADRMPTGCHGSTRRRPRSMRSPDSGTAAG